MAAKKRPAKELPRGRFGDMKGSKSRWHLENPKRTKGLKAVLVAKYPWNGANFAVFKIL